MQQSRHDTRLLEVLYPCAPSKNNVFRSETTTTARLNPASHIQKASRDSTLCS